MKRSELETALRPLVDTVGNRAWMRKFLTHPSTMELYTSLTGEMHPARSGHPPCSIMFTSAVEGEGRTSIATMFAVLSAAVERNRRVLLVDADTHRGTLGLMFGVAAEQPGLSEFCDGQAGVEECVTATGLPNLLVVPASRGAPAPVIFPPRRVEDFMREASRSFDLVILDGPAGSSTRDVLSIARAVDRVAVVVRYGYATRQQVSALIAELVRVEADVIGTVLNQREYPLPRFLYGH